MLLSNCLVSLCGTLEEFDVALRVNVDSHVWYDIRLYNFLSVFFAYLAYFFLGINDNWIQAFKGNVSSFAVDVYQSDINYFYRVFIQG